MNPEKFGNTLLLTLFLLVSATASATSPCPPLPEPNSLQLSLDQPDWVVARVTVIEQLPMATDESGLGTPVRVDEVYAGHFDTGFIRVLGTPGPLDCGFVGLPSTEVGSSWIVGMAGPNAFGTYGGFGAFSRVPTENGVVMGNVPGFQNAGGSRSLEEFADYMNTLAPNAETNDYYVSMVPRLPAPADSVSLRLLRKGDEGLPDCYVNTNAVLVDSANGLIQISFSPVRTVGFCAGPQLTKIGLGTLNSPSDQDHYTIEIFQESIGEAASPFQSGNQIASLNYPLRTELSGRAYPEVPSEGSVQSGIGVIRGWACEAQRVMVQFDDRAPLPLAYGTLRTDTRQICGDSNNGYGGVFAFGLLGVGQHTMRTFIDDKLVETVEFEVAGLDSPFATGLDATYVLEDFPITGKSVTVRWSEPAQNFIIVGD